MHQKGNWTKADGANAHHDQSIITPEKIHMAGITKLKSIFRKIKSEGR